MDTNKILQADILDIIFDGKNKLYGAYQLRKTYNKTLAKALIYTGSLMVFIFIGTVLAGAGNKKKEILIVGPSIHLTNIDHDIPPPKVLPPPKGTAKPDQVKFEKPIVVDNRLVDPKTQIEEITEHTMISSETIKSNIISQVGQVPITDSNSNVAELPLKKVGEPEIFTSVQIEAEFPGGVMAWKKYLENNLDAETPINNGAPEGTYTVMVRFVVSTDGSISSVEPETKIGYGLEAEAVKIIRNGPKWVPARQNGQQVNAYRRQQITFVASTP
jgi:protein TonB